MLWRRTAQTPITPSTAPVPDTEAIRRALLLASWQRSRWVARRRVAVRWALWILRRYGLYVLLPAAGALYYFHGDHGFLRSYSLFNARMPVPPNSTGPTPVRVQPPETPAAPAGSATGDQEALLLRFEASWPIAPTFAPASMDHGVEAGSDIDIPQLKPENWLHSKEP